MNNDGRGSLRKREYLFDYFWEPCLSKDSGVSEE